MLGGLHLVNFRSYTDWHHLFSRGVTVLVGANASGKTNVLEAIYMLSSGDSFRATRIEEMVHWDVEVGHVAGKVADEIPMRLARDARQNDRDDNSGIESLPEASSRQQEMTELRVAVTRGMVQGKRVAKRRFKVNGVGRRKKDFVGNLPSVLFVPDDLRLLSGSPTRRRGYLDATLTQTDGEYARSLSQYEKALKRRNKLLDLIREGEVARNTLVYWDALLVKHGEVIMHKRREYVDFLLAASDEVGGGRVEYRPSPITEKRLAEYAHKEIGAGYTLIGPHKDDFMVFDGERDLAIYGSRGEQRMTVLWLKMMQLSYLRESLETVPMLLLDDIFSELDQAHDIQVMELAHQQQTIITATELPEEMQSGRVQVIRIGKSE